MLEAFANVAAILLGVAGVSSLVFVGVRQGQILAMKSTMRAQAEAIGALEAELNLQRGRLAQYGRKLERVQEERDLQKALVAALIEGTAAAGVCTKAPGCPYRITPTAANN